MEMSERSMAYKWVTTLTPWQCDENVRMFHGLQMGGLQVGNNIWHHGCMMGTSERSMAY